MTEDNHMPDEIWAYKGYHRLWRTESVDPVHAHESGKYYHADLYTAVVAERDACKRECSTLRNIAVTRDEEVEKLRAVAAEMKVALERVSGMCDAPSSCTCGRPNGIGAVKHCADTALAAAEKAGV